MVKMRMSWVLRDAKGRTPMRYLREKLKKLRIDDFKVILREKDGDNAWVYLLKTDEQYVLAKVTIFVNEFDIMCANVGVVVLSSEFAKRVARRVLERDRTIETYLKVKERDGCGDEC